MWVGPHSARGLKPCSSAHEGMPGRWILSVRLNYTGTRDSCQRAKFSGQRAKFSVVGARKKYFLMNFRFRKVFAPLSAVREKSTGRVSSRTLAMVCTPMKMFLFSKNRHRSLVLLPPLVARTKLPQKKLFPLHFCSFVLHDCFH